MSARRVRLADVFVPAIAAASAARAEGNVPRRLAQPRGAEAPFNVGGLPRCGAAPVAHHSAPAPGDVQVVLVLPRGLKRMVPCVDRTLPFVGIFPEYLSKEVVTGGFVVCVVASDSGASAAASHRRGVTESQCQRQRQRQRLRAVLRSLLSSPSSSRKTASSRVCCTRCAARLRQTSTRTTIR